MTYSNPWETPVVPVYAMPREDTLPGSGPNHPTVDLNSQVGLGVNNEEKPMGSLDQQVGRAALNTNISVR